MSEKLFTVRYRGSEWRRPWEVVDTALSVISRHSSETLAKKAAERYAKEGCAHD